MMSLLKSQDTVWFSIIDLKWNTQETLLLYLQSSDLNCKNIFRTDMFPVYTLHDFENAATDDQDIEDFKGAFQALHNFK